MLLKKGADINAQRGYYGNTAGSVIKRSWSNGADNLSSIGGAEMFLYRSSLSRLSNMYHWTI